MTECELVVVVLCTRSVPPLSSYITVAFSESDGGSSDALHALVNANGLDEELAVSQVNKGPLLPLVVVAGSDIDCIF